MGDGLSIQTEETDPEKDSTFETINVPKYIGSDDESAVEKDLKAISVLNQTTSTNSTKDTCITKAYMEEEVLATKTVQSGDLFNTSDNLGIEDAPCHTGQDLVDLDRQVSMDFRITCKDSSACRADHEVADGQVEMLSEAFIQKSDDDSLRQISGDLSDISKDDQKETTEGLQEQDHDMRDNTSNHNMSELKDSSEVKVSTAAFSDNVLPVVQDESKCQGSTMELNHTQRKTQEEFGIDKNKELYNFPSCSTDMNVPINLIQQSPELDNIESSIKLCGMKGTEDKFNQTLLNSATSLDTLNETLVEQGVNKNITERTKMEPDNGERDKSTMMQKDSNTPGQPEEDNYTNKEETSFGILNEEVKNETLQEDTEMLDIKPSSPGNVPTPGDDADPSMVSTSYETTSSSSPKLERPHDLPVIFSGLKELKKKAGNNPKEAASPEQPETSDTIKQSSVIRGLFSDQRPKPENKGSILEQLSQLLSFDTSKVGMRKEKIFTSNSPVSPIVQTPSVENLADEGTEEDSKSTSAETALDTFRAFFTPKPVRRDTLDHVDLDAVKRAFKPEAIRALFDRNATKTPDNRTISDNKSAESEERTPGRLQAIWPPPKPKDEEEKIGLKYTEAEHQAALLHLKRECKEEVVTLEADFKLQIFQLKEENQKAVSRLQSDIAELKKLTQCSHNDVRDVAVSTDDIFTARTFRTVCIQTDREMFTKPNEDAKLNSGISPQPNLPKKLDLDSISRSLSGKQDPVSKLEQNSALPVLPHSPPPPPPPPPPLALTDESKFNNTTKQPARLLPGCCTVSSNPAPSMTVHSPHEQNNGIPPPPPPPPPPPTIGSGLLPPPPLPGFMPTHPARTDERPQSKQRIEPVCPMKMLYWTRIQIGDSRNNTLWSSLKEPALINSNEFAQLFAKMASPTKRKPLSEAYDKTVKAKKIIKVLDAKRSQAVGILISSLHLEMKDIKQAIITLDNSVVDVDAIEALYENRAQPEELERIRKHCETSNEEHVKLLDRPEQFLYELSKIPQFTLRSHCIILQSTFNDAVASIQCKTEKILQVCKDLLDRDSVRQVLGLILALGNYMNGGSRTRGQADGFGLEILPKLKDVKSRDNSLSLVDFVVSYYLRNLDENAGTEKCVFPLPEPEDVFLAAQVKFEDITKELRKLGKDLECCQKDLKSICLISSEEYIHPFKEKMEAFLFSAKNEQRAAEQHLTSAQESFHHLVQYFGMKPCSGEQDVQPSHVFILWFEFCNDLKPRWKRENKVIFKERLKEAQHSVHSIKSENKVETRQVHPNSLKKRLRQKEASLTSS